ncbi:hypothetical protein [Pediococcus pentosaceus]|uniref:hypothetical protein n=1 Tax=Pediococcus pentosaceus TaxID=1255 RepID=UPI0021A4F96D|nr:hypothetical protein [Pediococcus pentosaceus]MCT3033283.1 hypothetical protein [Pediococcus pentosaceus]
MKKANLLVLPTVLLALSAPILNTVHADTAKESTEQITKTDHKLGKSLMTSNVKNNVLHSDKATLSTIFQDDFSNGLNWIAVGNSNPQLGIDENGNKYAQLRSDTMVNGLSSDKGSYTISFDWRGSGEGSYDIMLYDRNVDPIGIVSSASVGRSTDSQWHTYTTTYTVEDKPSISLIRFSGSIDIDNISVTKA